MTRTAAVALLALGALLAGQGVPARVVGASPRGAATTTVASLPGGMLHFGLASSPSDLGWMTSSGVPWRYRYAYLSGGVNTGAGWETWNSPPGAYASFYMSASGGAGYIPVFSYYELLQSLPSTGTTESDRDYANLNNPTTMAAYYANFKLLMQAAAAYGNTVVVHVEPDLWGYLEQRAGSGDASTLGASVASSGFVDVAALPNTAQGFAWALLKLRDLYAPNVLLAIHASGWASGTDIDSSTDPMVNPSNVADATATFLNSAGISSNPFGSTWDLVFNDLDDHDAGWWEQQGADNQFFTHWWDPSNLRFPNFTRYLAWVAELKLKTGRPQVAWQVPVGNQYFLTMNNTCGHYQDNVAQYFVGHASALFASGLIAVLFGAGNSCQTTYTDARRDGVTNNGGASTSDLVGYCSACNTHTSVLPDDDGGFLRTFVGAYYGGWASLGGIFGSGPDAASWGTGRVDVFGQGADRGLWQNTFNGSAWSGWAPLGGVITADPGAVSWGVGRIDVFARGQDGALYHRYWGGSAWSGWEGLGGRLAYGPDAASWAAGRLDVFLVGLDHQLWHRYWGGAGWSGWEALGGYLSSAPGVVAWGPGRLDIFARGADNQMWHLAWANGWSGWQPLGGLFSSAPDAASCAAGHLDLYAVGSDHALWHEGWNGTAWTGWTPAGGYWASAPGAVCEPGSTAVSLTALGPDAAVWSTTVTGT